MDTLPDVNTRRGGTEPPHAGFASDVSPKAQDSLAGVSVRYAPNPRKRWYVLRATYNRALKAYGILIEKGIEAYLPVHYVQKDFNGKRKRLAEPLLPNLLFVYSTAEEVETCVKRTSELSFLSYYYNHFQVDSVGKNQPLTVDYDEMMNFIRVTSVDNEHIRIVGSEQCRFKGGDMVRVIEGGFAGVEGRVVRMSGQQCVVVELKGICLVATAYIPTRFLMRITT